MTFTYEMGIEWEISSTPYRVMLKYDKATPLQVIQDLVSLEPAYAFSVANGVSLGHKMITAQLKGLSGCRF